MSEEKYPSPQTAFTLCGIVVVGLLVFLWYVIKMALIDILPQVAWMANLLAIPLVVVLFIVIIATIANVING